jgi:nitrate reductase beta subunit
METRCMAACIGQIRLQGLVKMNTNGTWAEDRYNPLYYLVHVAKVALPLYPQLGTAPNGYYIPPRWVPRPYLHQMFGPGVDEAIERYMNPGSRAARRTAIVPALKFDHLQLQISRRPENL